MRLQRYRFQILGLSKMLVIGLMVVAIIWTYRSFLNFSNARKLQALPDGQFIQAVQNLRFDELPVETLRVIASRSLELTSFNIDVSERANRQLLNTPRPCLDCQNRIVFYDLTRNAKLTDTGLVALRKSFEQSPYGEENLMKWRLEVSSNFWNTLDDTLRKSALRQITALSENAANHEWLRNLTTDVPELKTRIAVLNP